MYRCNEPNPHYNTTSAYNIYVNNINIYNQNHSHISCIYYDCINNPYHCNSNYSYHFVNNTANFNDNFTTNKDNSIHHFTNNTNTDNSICHFVNNTDNFFNIPINYSTRYNYNIAAQRNW